MLRLRPVLQLRTICAWCDALIREGPLTPGGQCSHGICRDCAQTIFGYDPGPPITDLVRRAHALARH